MIRCARPKYFAPRALQLAHKVLNVHRGVHRDIPTPLQLDDEKLCMLMRAAKRKHDLRSARWLSLQISQRARDVDVNGASSFITEALMDIFYMYTVFRPPSIEGAMSAIPETAPPFSRQQPAKELSSPSLTMEAIGLPQSPQEVIHEATLLWRRNVSDFQGTVHRRLFGRQVFGRVVLTLRLINAYLAVHYTHSLPSESYRVYSDLFQSLGVQPDVHSYVLALEAYASGTTLSEHERSHALSAVREVWEDWLAFEEFNFGQLSAFRDPAIARLVSRAWAAMIRHLTLTQNYDEAESLLRQFVRRYPPSHGRKDLEQRDSTRIMTSSMMAENCVVPSLTMFDVALLFSHARITGRVPLINYITWVSAAYRRAIEPRGYTRLHFTSGMPMSNRYFLNEQQQDTVQEAHTEALKMIPEEGESPQAERELQPHRIMQDMHENTPQWGFDDSPETRLAEFEAAVQEPAMAVGSKSEMPHAAPSFESAHNQRASLLPSDEQCDVLLSSFAKRGLVKEADALVKRLASDIPSERQRDLLITARIEAQQLDEACRLLDRYEKTMHPAPMKSYTRVICALLHHRRPGSAFHTELAWDIFTSMRQGVHPVPDAALYGVMIRTTPEPQRAIDLFTEMTVEHHLVPDVYLYNSVISTCALSKGFELQAFRLVREMLNAHRDAPSNFPTPLSAFDNTLYALMEAASRMGDPSHRLSHTRWVVSQLLQSTHNIDEDAHDMNIGCQPSFHGITKVLTYLFHAYSAFRPTSNEGTMSVVSGEPSPKAKYQQTEESSSPCLPMGATDLPQSSQEVVRKATLVWRRFVAEELASDRLPITGRVVPNTRLLNAYLVVHYKHSLPSTSYEVYFDLFKSHGIQPDMFSYVFALEAYSDGSSLSQRERLHALSVAREIWKNWLAFEDSDFRKARAYENPETAQLVGRAWSAMIRHLTLAGHFDEAEACLREFVKRHPPRGIPVPLREAKVSRWRSRISAFLTFREIHRLHEYALATQRTSLAHFISRTMRLYEKQKFRVNSSRSVLKM